MIITVIIPTYKPQDYLWECLNSLINQTFPKNDFEVILVLNGPIEPFKTNIDKYIVEKMDGINTQLICTDIRGVSNARNIGLDYAHGEYITFLDDDDVISVEYLNELYKISSPICVGCANSYAFIDNTSIPQYNFISHAYQKCQKLSFTTYNYRSYLSPPWCKLIHKDIIGPERFCVDLKKGEDGMFCFSISRRIQHMSLTTEKAIYYQRLRGGSTMRRKSSIKNEFIELIHQEKRLLLEWIQHPLSYNILFLLSRIIGIIRNFLIYIKQ